MFRISNTLRFAIAAIMLLFATATRSTAQDYYSGNASYQQFYDELAPYGEWINDPEYGYVWVPDAGDDFRPYYTNGYWVNTEYGNTWVSGYDWGWAPFHYGRWTYSRYYGWTWIPGNQWGPAWVTWRSGGGAFGWAPLGPGISIDLAFGNNYYVPDYWWVFAPQQYILDRRFHRYTYGPRYNSNYLRRTSILNYTYSRNRDRYITGPRRRDLEVATGRSVRPVSLNPVNRPNRAELRNDRLDVYRPVIAEGRPRATERPRSFQPAAIPLPRNNREAGDQENRTGGYRTPRERGQNRTDDIVPVVRDRPSRNQGDTRPDRQRDDRINNPSNVDRPRRDVVTQPGRGEQVDQPQRNRDWNRNSDREPVRQPQVPQRNEQRDQQQQMDLRRAEQAQQRAQQEQQRGLQEQQRAQQQQQMELRRAEQAQQREQQRAQQQQQMDLRRAQEAERRQQQPAEQRPVREQRIETPRAEPRREAPATAPVREERIREERKPDGGGEGRSSFGGRRR